MNVRVGGLSFNCGSLARLFCGKLTFNLCPTLRLHTIAIAKLFTVALNRGSVQAVPLVFSYFRFPEPFLDDLLIDSTEILLH